jgi:hypothetical protein
VVHPDIPIRNGWAHNTLELRRDDSSAPSAWINQKVVVELHDAASSGVDVATGRGVFDTRSGTLKAANEFGIELDEPVADSGVE